VSLPGLLAGVSLECKIPSPLETLLFCKMSKKYFKRPRHFHPLLIIAVLLFLDFQSTAKQNGNIILKDEPVKVMPKEFYIAGVIDERDERAAVVWLIPLQGNQNQPKTYTVDLEGGGLSAIGQFIDHNLPCNKALRPIVISLKKFKATESVLPGGLVQGHIDIVMSFSLRQDSSEMLHLLDYKGNATYTRNPGPPQDIEPTMRHVLENGLIYLNTWMDKQAATNIKLAKAVKVTFTDYKENAEGDTIYYSVKRPLKWDDFQSKIPVSRFDAQVYPSIGYEEHVSVVNSIINVDLAIKVSLPKSAAWVRDGMQNDYTLNHEQRHFDIAKIVAEHFKQKINAGNLTVSNYEGIINFEYLDTYREMDKLQKQYDDETRHGTDRRAQLKWDLRIDKELNGH
jgi:hypothetical protein